MSETADQSGLPQARLYLAHVDQRIASNQRRASGVDFELALLVGGAAIAASVTTSQLGNPISLIAAAAFGVAAVVGVVGFVPDGSQPIDVARLRADLLLVDPVSATLTLADRCREQAAEDWKRLSRKAVLLRIGLGILAAGVVMLFLAALADSSVEF